MGGFRPSARSALAKRGATERGTQGANTSPEKYAVESSSATVWQTWQTTQDLQAELSDQEPVPAPA